MSIILAAHLIVVWSAVGLRIDRFPLTWAPMYSLYSPRKPVLEKNESKASESESQKVGDSSVSEDKGAKKIAKKYMLKDKKRLRKVGWLATRRDGSTINISQRDVNVPTRNMWRLYFQRSFNNAAPKYGQMNHHGGTWDRIIWGLEPGEPWLEYDWARRLLVSINKTFEVEPDDAEFIVVLEAHYDSTVIYSDGSTAVQKNTKQTMIHWDEAWSEDL